MNLGTLYTSVAGRRLPSGTRPSIAAGLDRADRDLAIRLLTRPADAPWWALELHGATLERGDGSGSERHEAEGQLHPILIDALGAPVRGSLDPIVWAGEQRWYVLPDTIDWFRRARE